MPGAKRQAAIAETEGIYPPNLSTLSSGNITSGSSSIGVTDSGETTPETTPLDSPLSPVASPRPSRSRSASPVVRSDRRVS